MRNTNKKGFTIVELVIVVAVIAILAAVLIPTFSGIIKRANLSADQQAVRQMNNALAMYAAENSKPANKTEAKKALDAYDINVESLTPVSKGYAFYWDSAKNEIVLVANGDEVKAGWEILSHSEYGEQKTVGSVADLTATISEADSKPVYIKLSSDIALPDALNVDGAKVVTIDLNGKKLTVDKAIQVTNGADLTIKGGDISSSAQIKNISSTLVLEDVKLTSTVVAPVVIDGYCDTTILNTAIDTTGYFAISTNSSKDTSDGARMVIANSNIKATGNLAAAICITIHADLRIEDSKVEGLAQALVMHSGNLVAKNTEFVSTLAECGDWNDKTPQSGNCVSAAAVSVMAHGGSGYGKVGIFNFENCQFTSGNPNATVYVYSGAGCQATVNGIGNAKVNETNRGEGKITINK